MANELKFPKWQEPYLEALMETDERKLVKRVKLAESAILMRLRAIQSDWNMVVEKQGHRRRVERFDRPQKVDSPASGELSKFASPLRRPAEAGIATRDAKCPWNGPRKTLMKPQFVPPRISEVCRFEQS
jgi:hypothetical protein